MYGASLLRLKLLFHCEKWPSRSREKSQSSVRQLAQESLTRGMWRWTAPHCEDIYFHIVNLVICEDIKMFFSKAVFLVINVIVAWERGIEGAGDFRSEKSKAVKCSACIYWALFVYQAFVLRNSYLCSKYLSNKKGLLWWLSAKESVCQCREWELYPWFRKIPQRRKWQHTPVFLPGRAHGWTEEPGRLYSIGLQESHTGLSD